MNTSTSAQITAIQLPAAPSWVATEPAARAARIGLALFIAVSAVTLGLILAPGGARAQAPVQGAGVVTRPALVLDSHHPATNTVAAPLDSSIVLTYSAAVDAATVTSRTVAVHSMLQGLVTETHSVDGAAITVDPGRALFPGELVYTVATTRTTDLTGTHPLSPTVWQFNAAVTQGWGHFAPVPITFGAGNDNTYSVAWGDFDGDGDLDLAVGNRGGQSAVYRNNGDGTFDNANPVNFGSGSDLTYSLAWGDYDNDGDLDLAVGNEFEQNVVYPNNGNGTFGAAVNVGPANDVTNSVAWGDFDGDGYLDLAVGNYEASVGAGFGQGAIYRNNRDGSFASTPINFGTNDRLTTSVAWGDCDNDGDLDLAVGNLEQQNVVYRNNGDGTFDNDNPIPFGPGDDPTMSVAWGDYDNDGDLDLAVGNLFEQNVVYPNSGDGAFASTPVPFGPGDDPTIRVAWGDFDNDGDLDLAVGNSGGQSAVYPNNGDGTFGAAVNFGPTTDIAFSVAWGDVDNDGDLDLAVGNQGQQNAVYRNEQWLPDLTVSKSVTPAAAAAGQAITYTLPFSNAGGPATGVVITDNVPVSVTNVSSNSSGAVITQTGAAPNFVWQVEELAPGAGGVITLTGVLISPLALGVFTNTVEIADAGVDSEPTNNQSSAALSVCGNPVTVINTDDDGPGSLRWAVTNACPSGVVNFDMTYPATITLTTGEITIDKELTIDGPGAGQVAVSGNNASRILTVSGSGKVTIQGLTLRDGAANSGGAIYSAAPLLTVTQIAVISNSAATYAGAIEAIGALVISGSQFIGNVSNGDDGYGVGAGAIYGHGDITLINSLFQENQALGANAGALYTWDTVVTITDTDFLSNTATGSYGAVFVEAYDDTPVTSMAGGCFQGNLAGVDAGAIGAGGILEISAVCFRDNQARSRGGAVLSTDLLTLINVTFSGNAAGTDGGAVYNIGYGGASSPTLTNVTFSGNAAGTDGGAMYNIGYDGVSSPNLVNVILWGNTATNGAQLYNVSATPVIRNTMTPSSTTDLYTDAGAITWGPGNITDGSDPLFGTLGDYGGSTQTIPLLPGSPAIDSGDAGACPATDQRGIARPQGGGCDIGAFESRGFGLTRLSGDNQSTPRSTLFSAPLVVAVGSSHTEPVDGGRLTVVGPPGGAGITPITNTVTIHGGTGAFTPTANNTVGSYIVVADTAGAAAEVTFTLTNTLPTTPTALNPEPEPDVDAHRLYLPAILSGMTAPEQEMQETTDGAEPVVSEIETTAAPEVQPMKPEAPPRSGENPAPDGANVPDVPPVQYLPSVSR